MPLTTLFRGALQLSKNLHDELSLKYSLVSESNISGEEMEFKDNTKKLICPFDSSHEIIESRMAKHILQCQKNYPNTDLLVCPFNAIHLVPGKYLTVHIENCSSKELFYRDQYVIVDDYDPNREKERNALAKAADQIIFRYKPKNNQKDIEWDVPEEKSYLEELSKRLQKLNILRQGELNTSKSVSKKKWEDEKCRLQRLLPHAGNL